MKSPSFLLVFSLAMLLCSPLNFGLPEGFVAETLADRAINEGTSLAPVLDGRIFISERAGKLRVWENGEIFDIAEWPVGRGEQWGDENGFLKVIPHPNFSDNGKLYAYYAVEDNSHHVIDILEVSGENAMISQTTITHLDSIVPGEMIWHNGGAMAFGVDGFLYVGRGDNLEAAQAENPANQIGKILRFTETGEPAPGNPWYNSEIPQQRTVWATGFRNPWVLATDPLSGRIYCAMVGEFYEEINEVSSPDPGKNYWYGWGSEKLDGFLNMEDRIDPVISYRTNSADGGKAVLSVAPYNPPFNNFGPEYAGMAFYNDITLPYIRYFNMNDPGAGVFLFDEETLTGMRDLSMVIDPLGRMLFVTYREDFGDIVRIYNKNNMPTPVQKARVAQGLPEVRPRWASSKKSGLLQFIPAGPKINFVTASLIISDIRGRQTLTLVPSQDLEFQIPENSHSGPGIWHYQLTLGTAKGPYSYTGLLAGY